MARPRQVLASQDANMVKRSKLNWILALTAAAAILWFAVSSPAVRWRAAFIRAKVAGYFPGATVMDVVRAMYPYWWGKQKRAQMVRMEATRPGPCPVLWRTPVGFFWGDESDSAILQQRVWHRISRIMEGGPAIVRRGDVVLDAGATLGAFTRTSLLRGARKVIALEPDAGYFTCFKRSFEKEIREGSVVLVPALAWETSGATVSGTEYPVKYSEHVEPVRTTTIDETVKSLELDRVDFIRISSEGFERNSLAGARETIKRFKPRMEIAIHNTVYDVFVVQSAVLGIDPNYNMIMGTTQAYFYK